MPRSQITVRALKERGGEREKRERERERERENEREREKGRERERGGVTNLSSVPLCCLIGKPLAPNG